MAEAKTPVPTGGKKGGAVFPRYGLESSVAAAKRLVSKSHTGPIPKDIYFAGVLQLTGPRADVKASALKQFGLVQGTGKTGLAATSVAKTIASADDSERTQALRKAALSPKVFKGIFDTFHGDSVTRSRLRQRASELNVHPDMLEMCVKIYVESLAFAALVTVTGDQVAHAPVAAERPAIASEGNCDAVIEEQFSAEGGTPPVAPADEAAVEILARNHRPARATIGGCQLSCRLNEVFRLRF